MVLHFNCRIVTIQDVSDVVIKINADFNTSKNIRDKSSCNRETLLKQLDNGAFERRNLNVKKVKEGAIIVSETYQGGNHMRTSEYI